MAYGTADIVQGVGNTYYAIKGEDKEMPNFVQEGYKAAGRTVGRLIGGEKGAQVGEKIGSGAFFVVDTALSFVSGKAILNGVKTAKQGTTLFKGTQQVLKATGKNIATNAKGAFKAVKELPGKVKDTGSNVVKKFSRLFVKDNKAVDNSLTSLLGETNKKRSLKLDLQFFASKGDDVAKETSKVEEVTVKGKEACGPFYDIIKQKHIENPAYFPNPDDIKVVEGIPYNEARKEYTNMVNSGKLEPGHHILGVADGGKNVQSNITPTGEKFLSRNDLHQEAMDYYDSIYGTKKNPHPKRIAIYEQDGKVNFGKNPSHTEATTLQQNLHNWQKENGLRK